MGIGGLGIYGQSGQGPLGSTLSGRQQFLGRINSNVHRAFELCLSRIELDPTRVKEASQHYNAVKDWLESKMNVTVRQVGSFQRNTKNRPIVEQGKVSRIDVDALVCFGDATCFAASWDDGTTPESALTQVRKALMLNGTYKLLEPEIDHPVVTLSYANEFFIELVPCFRNRFPPENTYRDPASYLVANSLGGWEDADYDFDSQYITQANKNSDGNLVPAIKLLKRFIRNKQIGLKSFQVEVLAGLLLEPFFEVAPQNHPNWQWQDALWFFLKVAPALLANNPTIPGSKTPHIPVNNLPTVQAILLEYAGLFDDLRKLPDNDETLRLYRAAYGAPFPSSL
jgi:hypothetical protein